MVQKTEQTILQRKPEYIEQLEQGIFYALFFTRDDREFIQMLMVIKYQILTLVNN